ncbi:MAG: S-methyl-5-thioribose-1-phosphate isomerase [Atribacterota bacterium]
MRRTIEWKENAVLMIDQRKLPHKLEIFTCKNYHEVAKAIKKMVIRGAPAIGAAAAYGMALAANNSTKKSSVQFIRELEKAKIELLSTRPTAINLFWALKEIWNIVEEKRYTTCELKEKILLKAEEIAENDIKINHMIGENGVELFNEGDSILTHCNAGSLATVSYGTALGVIRSVFEKKKNIKVFANETRPVLQGARITAWELYYDNIPTTLICDSVAGFLMSRGKINKVIVGADRIASNGDFANKIGTYSISVLAKKHRVPFFVAAPISTIDFSIKKGLEIPIEERDSNEVTTISGKSIAPRDIDVYNPAFDITPYHNISAIITEKGVIFPPFAINIKKVITK